MMKGFGVFALCLCLSFAGGAARAVEPLSIDLAEKHIDITTGFTGASIVVFGVKHGAGDVAIVVEGPRRDVIVRRKDNIMGAWINRSWMRFKDVPLYYDYAVMEGDETSAEIAGLDVGSLVFTPDGHKKDFERYRDAFVSGRQGAEFYPQVPASIEYIGSELFKARMFMPANVPKGEYRVKALLIQGGKVVSEKVTGFKVGQVGFSSGVNQFAKTKSFFYAMICVLIAMTAGWLSHKIVRRS